jgi:nitrate reductase NapAB chaperone NapD
MSVEVVAQENLSAYLSGNDVFFDIVTALSNHRLIYGHTKGKVTVVMDHRAHDAACEYIERVREIEGGVFIVMKTIQLDESNFPKIPFTDLFGFDVKRTTLDNDVMWQLWFEDGE